MGFWEIVVYFSFRVCSLWKVVHVSEGCVMWTTFLCKETMVGSLPMCTNPRSQWDTHFWGHNPCLIFTKNVAVIVLQKFRLPRVLPGMYPTPERPLGCSSNKCSGSLRVLSTSKQSLPFLHVVMGQCYSSFLSPSFLPFETHRSAVVNLAVSCRALQCLAAKTVLVGVGIWIVTRCFGCCCLLSFDTTSWETPRRIWVDQPIWTPFCLLPLVYAKCYTDCRSKPGAEDHHEVSQVTPAFCVAPDCPEDAFLHLQ